MSKPLLYSIIIGSILGFLSIGIAIFASQSESAKSSEGESLLQKIASPAKENNLNDEPLKTYIDESGFSLQHYESIKIYPTVAEMDAEYYADLTFEYSKQYGYLRIKDTTYKTPSEWVSSEKSLSDAKLTGATTLGGLQATEYETKNKLYTVLVDQGVLYVLEFPKDNSYWQHGAEVIVGSFNFGNTVRGTKSSVNQAAESIIYEEEEVIE